jgi:hypothetical protein
MDKKIENGSVKYLIKWQGWSDKDSTWEPISNLSNIFEMINEWEVKNGLMKTKKMQSPISIKSLEKSTHYKSPDLKEKKATKIINLLENS